MESFQSAQAIQNQWGKVIVKVVVLLMKSWIQLTHLDHGYFHIESREKKKQSRFKIDGSTSSLDSKNPPPVASVFFFRRWGRPWYLGSFRGQGMVRSQLQTFNWWKDDLQQPKKKRTPQKTTPSIPSIPPQKNKQFPFVLQKSGQTWLERLVWGEFYFCILSRFFLMSFILRHHDRTGEKKHDWQRCYPAVCSGDSSRTCWEIKDPSDGSPTKSAQV